MPIVTVSYWIISAIIALGKTFNTANGKDTNKAKTHASINLLPGNLSLKQITISAIEKTMQPKIIGNFLPLFFANLFTKGYKAKDQRIEIANINTE